MIGYILNTIGLAVVGSYAALNYSTYQAINNNIQVMYGDKARPVTFSPTFNYHSQLQKRFNYLSPSYFQFREENIFSLFTVNINITRNTYLYTYKLGNYKLFFGFGESD